MRGTIEFQGQLVKAKPHRASNKKIAPPEGGRGTVQDFSRKSRGRMLEKVARLSKKNVVHFITFTFDDSSIPHDTIELQSHLRAFWEKMRRDYPESSAIWRIELKPRQSGVYIGHVVPHVHILLWGASLELPRRDSLHYSGDACDIWTRIVTRNRPEMKQAVDAGWRIRCDHKELIGARGVMYYVSKYCAKVEKDEVSKDALLVYLPYSHTGRFWGVYNAKNLPFDHLTVVTLEDDSWVYEEFKSECAAEYYQLHFYGQYQGFKLFTDDARDYLILLDQLIDDLRYVPYYRDIEY